MAVNANEGAFSPTLNNPAARTSCAARTGASNAPRMRIIRFIAASITSLRLSTQNVLARYPTMQIFSWAMATAIRRTGTHAEHDRLRWKEKPQAAQKVRPARPQGVRRLRRTLGVRRKETHD